MADLSISLAALLRKNVQTPLRWDMLKCTICFQNCATCSSERGDSLACVCEERFLRKSRVKSYLTFKSYCQHRTYPKYMPFIFYGRPLAIWFAGDFLQCHWPWLGFFLTKRVIHGLDFIQLEVLRMTMYEENIMDFCITAMWFESQRNRCPKLLKSIILWNLSGLSPGPRGGGGGLTAPPDPSWILWTPPKVSLCTPLGSVGYFWPDGYELLGCG